MRKSYESRPDLSITDLVIQHYTNDWRPLYHAGLQINWTSFRSGFRVQGSKFRVNRFALFPLTIDFIGLIPRELNL